MGTRASVDTGCSPRRGAWPSLTVACGVMLALVLLLSGCQSWALSSGSELDQAGRTVYSQVQVMALVTDTALRHDRPATVSLEVMLDDAESELTDQESAIAQIPPDEPRRAEILAITRVAVAELSGLRGALDAGDRAALREVRGALRAASARLTAAGVS